MNPEFDSKDQAILENAQKHFDECQGIRVGDFVYYGKNRIKRVAHIHEDNEIQLTENGSYYFNNGFCEMSGSLDSTSKGEFIATNETMKGRVWFFHHNRAEGHNGVYCNAIFRVFRFKGPIEPPRAYHLTMWTTITDEMRERYGIKKPFRVEQYNYPHISFDTKEQLITWMREHDLVISAHCRDDADLKTYSLDCDSDMEISLATLRLHEEGLRLEAYQASHFDNWELYNSAIRARRALLQL